MVPETPPTIETLSDGTVLVFGPPPSALSCKECGGLGLEIAPGYAPSQVLSTGKLWHKDMPMNALTDLELQELRVNLINRPAQAMKPERTRIALCSACQGAPPHSMDIVAMARGLWNDQNYDDAIGILATLTGSRGIGQAIASGRFDARAEGATLVVTVPDGFQEALRDGLFVVRPPLYEALHDLAKLVWLGVPFRWDPEREGELTEKSDEARRVLDWLASEASPSIEDQVTAFGMIGDVLMLVAPAPSLQQRPLPEEWLTAREDALIALNETRDTLKALAESRGLVWPEEEGGTTSAPAPIVVGGTYRWSRYASVRVLRIDPKTRQAEIEVKHPTEGTFRQYVRLSELGT